MMVLCDYCGESEAVKVICNPNGLDDDECLSWHVCLDCEEAIREQHKLSFGCMLAGMDSSSVSKEHRQEYARKIINEANEKLAEIAKRTGKDIMSAGLHRQPDGHFEVVSVIFKGGDKRG
jgi:DNA primase